MGTRRADAARRSSRPRCPRTLAIVSSGWRYGHVLDRARRASARSSPSSGGWPPELDYAGCFARGIRVLSAAPAFAAAVAEMALALALACARDLVAEDRAMRAGEERFLSNAGRARHLPPATASGWASSDSGTSADGLRRLLEPFALRVPCVRPVADRRLSARRGRRARRPRATARDVSPRLRARDPDERERSPPLARPARARAARRSTRPRQPSSCRRLRRTDGARARRTLPRGDRRLSRSSRSIRAIRFATASGAVLSPHRAGLVQEALREIGRRVVDDLDAIVNGLPPRRLQVAEPELATRYVRTTQIPGDVG